MLKCASYFVILSLTFLCFVLFLEGWLNFYVSKFIFFLFRKKFCVLFRPSSLKNDTESTLLVSLSLMKNLKIWENSENIKHP